MKNWLGNLVSPRIHFFVTTPEKLFVRLQLATNEIPINFKLEQLHYVFAFADE